MSEHPCEEPEPKTLKEQINQIFIEEKRNKKLVQSHPFGTIEAIRLRIVNEVVKGLVSELQNMKRKEVWVTSLHFDNGFNYALDKILLLLEPNKNE